MESLCINCGISLNRLKRHQALQLDTRVISLLSEWISPRIILETDYVCEACRNLALRRVNVNLSEDTEASSPLQTVGHTRVCILCGKSILRRQSNAIIRAHPTATQQAIERIVSGWIQPRELTQSCRLCQPCWLRMHRSASRQHQLQHIVGKTNEEIESTETISHMVEDNSVSVVSDAQSSQNESVEQSADVVNVEHSPIVPDERHNNSILLNNYKRAANTSRHCVFHGCTSSTLHRISDSLRSQILCDHKFYLPCHARVCDNHLRSNLWGTLYDSENSCSSFNPEHVEHVFSFVNRKATTPDFNDVLAMEDHLFHYLLGLSKQNFQTILNEVPRITTTVRGTVGLSGLLIKLRTGDSDERIASLMKIPRRTLEGLINKVREILILDYVPLNLGINQISREQLLSRNRTIPNGVYR